MGLPKLWQDFSDDGQLYAFSNFFLPDIFFIEKKGIGSFYNKLCNWVKQDIQHF
jgi:hypothetical protein